MTILIKKHIHFSISVIIIKIVWDLFKGILGFPLKYLHIICILYYSYPINISVPLSHYIG